MRKFAVFLCLVATLLSLFGCEKKEIQKNYTHGVYEVTISGYQLYNNHIGNDWEMLYMCDNRRISSGERWTLPLGMEKTITIDITLTECDLWDDIGFGSLSVVLKDDYKTSTTVTVIENKGRYKGNKAQWEITCLVKLVEKLELI